MLNRRGFFTRAIGGLAALAGVKAIEPASKAATKPAAKIGDCTFMMVGDSCVNGAYERRTLSLCLPEKVPHTLEPFRAG